MLDMRRLCAWCGAELPERKRSDAMFCNRTCAMAEYGALERAARLEEKRNRPPCEWCGAPIPAEASLKKKFCNLSCQMRAFRRKAKAAQPARTCPECGGGFQASYPKQTWCGKSCSATAWQRTRRRG